MKAQINELKAQTSFNIDHLTFFVFRAYLSKYGGKRSGIPRRTNNTLQLSLDRTRTPLYKK